MPRKIKGFSRVDSDDARGWLVRIKRGELRRSRFISDSTHGGKRKAQLEAQRVYEEWTKELPEPDTAEDKIGVRNTSGVVGVHYSHDVDDRYPNCSYEYYVASWKTDEGKRQNIRFAFNKWGEKVAFELACIARDGRLKDRDKIMAIYERKQGASKKKAGTTKKTPAKKKAAVKTAAVKKSATSKKVAKKVASKKSSLIKTTAKKTAKKRKR